MICMPVILTSLLDIEGITMDKNKILKAAQLANDDEGKRKKEYHFKKSKYYIWPLFTGVALHANYPVTSSRIA